MAVARGDTITQAQLRSLAALANTKLAGHSKYGWLANPNGFEFTEFSESVFPPGRRPTVSEFAPDRVVDGVITHYAEGVGSGGYTDTGHPQIVHVYSYATIDGRKTYSSKYAVGIVSGEANGLKFTIEWSWDAPTQGVEPDGYLISYAHSANEVGPSVGAWAETESTSFVDGGITRGNARGTLNDPFEGAHNGGTEQENLTLSLEKRNPVESAIEERNWLHSETGEYLGSGAFPSTYVPGQWLSELSLIRAFLINTGEYTIDTDWLVSGPWCVAVGSVLRCEIDQLYYGVTSDQPYKDIEYWFAAASDDDVTFEQVHFGNWINGWRTGIPNDASAHTAYGRMVWTLDAGAGETFASSTLLFSVTGGSDTIVSQDFYADMDSDGKEIAVLDYEVSVYYEPDSTWQFQLATVAATKDPSLLEWKLVLKTETPVTPTAALALHPTLPVWKASFSGYLTETGANAISVRGGDGIWVAKTLPAHAEHSLLQVDLPNYAWPWEGTGNYNPVYSNDLPASCSPWAQSALLFYSSEEFTNQDGPLYVSDPEVLAAPWPSRITVDSSVPRTAGRYGSHFSLFVSVKGVFHGFPKDMWAVLVNPGGKGVLLWGSIMEQGSWHAEDNPGGVVMPCEFVFSDLFKLSDNNMTVFPVPGSSSGRFHPGLAMATDGQPDNTATNFWIEDFTIAPGGGYYRINLDAEIGDITYAPAGTKVRTWIYQQLSDHRFYGPGYPASPENGNNVATENDLYTEFAAFTGDELAGDWKLYFFDWGGLDGGQITSWSIRMEWSDPVLSRTNKPALWPVLRDTEFWTWGATYGPKGRWPAPYCLNLTDSTSSSYIRNKNICDPYHRFYEWPWLSWINANTQAMQPWLRVAEGKMSRGEYSGTNDGLGNPIWGAARSYSFSKDCYSVELFADDPDVIVYATDLSTIEPGQIVPVIDPNNALTYRWAAAGALTIDAAGIASMPDDGGFNSTRLYFAVFNDSVTVTPTSITSSGTTATVTKPGHRLKTGDMVTVAGADQAAYNGTFVVTVVDEDHFTYTMPSSAASPATGTITYTPLNKERSAVVRYVINTKADYSPRFFKTVGASDKNDLEGFSFLSYNQEPFRLSTHKGYLQIPDKGYCLTRLVAKRKPVGDPIALTPGSGTERVVSLGVVRDHAYPEGGTYVELGTVTFPSNKGTLTIDLTNGGTLPGWPVLGGCPLAYQCDEELEIQAFCNFQPMVFSQYRTEMDGDVFRAYIPDNAYGSFSGMVSPYPDNYSTTGLLSELSRVVWTTRIMIGAIDRAAFSDWIVWPVAACLYNDTEALLNNL